MPKSKELKHGLLDTWGRSGNRKHKDKPCEVCGKIFRPRKSTSRFCSRPCLWSTNGGHNKKEESWWINPRGYVEGRITLPDGTKIRVKQHRFTMEGILGRPLNKWEDVHHVDGNKQNNDPNNLEVIEHGSHTTHSNKSRIYRRGYKLVLTEDERKKRSLMAIAMRLNEIGRSAVRKAT